MTVPLLLVVACASPGAAARDEGGDAGAVDVADARDPGGWRDVPDAAPRDDVAPGCDFPCPDVPEDVPEDVPRDPVADDDPAPDPAGDPSPGDEATPDVADAPAADVPAADAPAADAPGDLPPRDEAAADGNADPGPPPPAPATRDDLRDLVAACTAQSLDDFLRDRYDGPACDASGCTVLVAVAGTAVSLRGEFNAWAESPMTPVACRSGAFWAEVGPVPAGSDAWQYRLFVDGAWRDDPGNRWIRFTDVSINNAMYRPGVPRLARVAGIRSDALPTARDLYVHVPAEAFADPARRFPVMLLQDGWNVFDNPRAPYGSWLVDRTARELAAAGAIDPPILVGVTTDDRIDEYLYTDFWVSGLGDPIRVDPRLPAYADLLVDTVLPRVRADFPARTGPADTAIGGSSLGGISSFWIAWNRADVFGKVAALSPSFWVGEAGSGTEENPSMREVMALAPPTAAQRALKVYLDSGDGGYSPGGGTDPAYAWDGHAYTDWTRNLLVALGWPNRAEWDTDGDLSTPPEDLALSTDPAAVPALEWAAAPPAAYAGWDDYLRPDRSLLCLLGVGHVHNEAAWAARFPAVLRFLFPAP